jgi:hypothetical protein
MFLTTPYDFQLYFYHSETISSHKNLCSSQISFVFEHSLQADFAHDQSNSLEGSQIFD